MADLPRRAAHRWFAPRAERWTVIGTTASGDAVVSRSDATDCRHRTCLRFDVAHAKLVPFADGGAVVPLDHEQ